MRNGILLIFCLITAGLSAQSDQRLEGLFSASQIQTMQSQSPGALEFWIYVADNGVVFFNDNEKEVDTSDLPAIDMTADFNLLAHTDLIGKNRSYYRSSSTGELIMIKSMSELTTGFNKEREGGK